MLRSHTNMRAVPDPQSPTGWKLEAGPFPAGRSCRSGDHRPAWEHGEPRTSHLGGLHRGPQPQGADGDPPQDAHAARERVIKMRFGIGDGSEHRSRRSDRASWSRASASGRSRRRRSGSCATRAAPASSRRSWRGAWSSHLGRPKGDRGSSSPGAASPPGGVRVRVLQPRTRRQRGQRSFSGPRPAPATEEVATVRVGPAPAAAITFSDRSLGTW